MVLVLNGATSAPKSVLRLLLDKGLTPIRNLMECYATPWRLWRAAKTSKLLLFHSLSYRGTFVNLLVKVNFNQL